MSGRTRGFYPAEDWALQNLVKNWENLSGNTVNLSMITTVNLSMISCQALTQKIISAMASGEVICGP